MEDDSTTKDELIMEGNINILETEALSRGSDTDLWVFENYNQRIAIATILCLVFIVGSIGNTLVITAVVLSRELRSSTNWFVVNLGCSDLLTCLCLPFYAVAMLSRDGWPLPGWICVANAAMVMICMGASVMTLALIAFNRWYLLTNTRKLSEKLYTTRNICFMVVSAWLYPIILVLVPHFAWLGRLGYSYEYKSCSQDTSLPTSDLYSSIAMAGAIMPVFTAIVVSYVRIYLFLSRHSKKPKKHIQEGAPQTRNLDNVNLVQLTEPSTSTHEETITQSRSTSNLDAPSLIAVTYTSNGEGNLTPLEISENQSRWPPEDKCNQKYDITVTKKHAVVVLAFIICLLPFGVSVSGFLSDPGIPWTGLLLAVNSCVNPLIYAGIWREFRNVMLAIIRFRLKDIPEPITCVRRFV
eukprot:XP_796582.1 PREDICTED: alpha-1B adrenergic receptor-like [Strongylocentrotus purpuratus]